jgi:hypothetical protein
VPAVYDHDMQLGHWDVSAEVLNAPGEPLDAMIGVSAGSIANDLLGPPPVDGWRLIAGSLNDPFQEPAVVAAPWADPRGNGWMVLQLWRREGHWGATVPFDRKPLRPSRALRRRGLRLAWSAASDHALHRIRPDTGLDEVPLVLRNDGPDDWQNQYGDVNGVLLVVTDERGQRVTNNHRGIDWGIVAHLVERLPPLEVGREITLMAHFDASTADYGLRASTYAIVGHMHSLGLRTSPRTLVVATDG